MKPTKTLARLTRRSASPPSAMMPPARMKNGIASSAKSSVPSDDLEHHGLERDVDPERREHGREAERVGDRHAQRAQDRKAADQDQKVHGAIRCRLVGAHRRRLAASTGSSNSRPVHSRSITNSAVIAPPIGTGR